MIQPGHVFRFKSFEKVGNSAMAAWHIPTDCPYLNGHFPHLPVLPAVALLDGSLELIRLTGAELPTQKLALKKAKFMGIVAPGMDLRITLLHIENRFDVKWLRAETNESLASFSFVI